MLLIPGDDFAWLKKHVRTKMETRPDVLAFSSARVALYHGWYKLMRPAMLASGPWCIGLWTMVYRAMDRGVSGCVPWCTGLCGLTYRASELDSSEGTVSCICRCCKLVFIVSLYLAQLCMQNRISKTLLTLLKKLISVKRQLGNLKGSLTKSASLSRLLNKISKVSKVFEILICKTGLISNRHFFGFRLKFQPM